MDSFSEPNSLRLPDDIHSHLMPLPQQSSNSFTALLELPPNQALELLQTPDSSHKPFFLPNNLTLPTNAALVERAARFSVFAGNDSPETSNSAAPVKTEPLEIEPDPSLNRGTSQKRKEREKKLDNRLFEWIHEQIYGAVDAENTLEIRINAEGSSKKSKNASCEEGEKLPYVHVRARRGQATDSHSLAERARREKINARMKLLQGLVPGCNKISGTALVLDEIINHVQSLQRLVEFLSMRLAAVNPGIDFNLDSIFAAESGSVGDCNVPGPIMPLSWPDVQVNGNRQQYQDQLNFDSLNQPVWGREDSYNIIIPENSLLTYDSSTNSERDRLKEFYLTENQRGDAASLHSNQLKMEL